MEETGLWVTALPTLLPNPTSDPAESAISTAQVSLPVFHFRAVHHIRPEVPMSLRSSWSVTTQLSSKPTEQTIQELVFSSVYFSSLATQHPPSLLPNHLLSCCPKHREHFYPEPLPRCSLYLGYIDSPASYRRSVHVT